MKNILTIIMTCALANSAVFGAPVSLAKAQSALAAATTPQKKIFAYGKIAAAYREQALAPATSAADAENATREITKALTTSRDLFPQVKTTETILGGIKVILDSIERYEKEAQAAVDKKKALAEQGTQAQENLYPLAESLSVLHDKLALAH